MTVDARPDLAAPFARYRTGTLTQNVMSVASVFLFGEEFTPLQARDRLAARNGGPIGVRALQILASVCNAAKVRPRS